jgi:hypothetical protein
MSMLISASSSLKSIRIYALASLSVIGSVETGDVTMNWLLKLFYSKDG